MKIGIITQPLHTNYGGLLQNYALQQILKRLGHTPITLDQGKTSVPLWRIIILYIKVFVLKLIGKGGKVQYPYLFLKKKQIYISQHTKYFIDKYIDHTEVFFSIEDFRNYVVKNKLEALVVGSDQVWRPIYNRNVLCSFFDFADGLQIKRLAYAASFGVDNWEFSKQQTSRCRELIRDFEAVSVREYSGIDLCRNFLCCDATHVLDPTMLLDKEDYIKLVENEHEKSCEGSLFTYILDKSDEKRNIIDMVASELKIAPFSSMPAHGNDVYPPVTQWIRSFIDAEFVICDSFHGVVFSIIFNKPFLIIGNRRRGISRFDSILKMFGLENRMIDNMGSVMKIVNTPINWSKVNAIRTEMKYNSIEFLNKNLNK